MDVGVDHHEHQVIDALVGDQPGEGALDCGDGIGLLVERCTRQPRISCRIGFRCENQGAERDLRRPQQHDPMLELLEQGRWKAELFDGLIHRRSVRLRSNACHPKWRRRRRKPHERAESKGVPVAVVAQLVRASVCGTEGRGFKSPRSPHSLHLQPDILREMTTPWGLPDFDEHEEIHFVTDEKSGLRAIIAVHSTHLGPAAGGVRFWHYAKDSEALTDALRLSRGMSYKNTMAGLPLG